MEGDRRQFLTRSSLLAMFPLLGGEFFELLAQEPQNGPPGTVFDQSVYDFWTNKVSAPYDNFLSGVVVKGGQAPPRNSTFIFPSTSGLVPATLLKPTDIQGFPDSGDVDVSVSVERFRPSPADAAILADLQSGTLRIDVKQVQPLVGLPEALAWTAMSTLASRQKNQKIQTLDNVTFDPGTSWGTAQKIPLPGGTGFWSWNFFMKRRTGFWGKFLDTVLQTIKTAGPMFPILGIPGIAVSGLTYLNQIMGVIQAENDSNWMFQGLDMAVCGTKQGFTNAAVNGANTLLLTSGSYIVFPENQVSRLDKDLVVQSGLLVPPNTPPLQIFQAAAGVLPDVSYMTISVKASASSKTSSTSPDSSNPSSTNQGPSGTSKPKASSTPK